MNTLRTFIAVCFAAACAYSVQAQTGRSEQVKDSTLNRTVVVEQEYIPHITDVRKMDVLPRVEQPVATSRMVRYADELRPVSRVPSSAMPSYSGNEKQPDATRGYLQAGYGNRGNVEALASYLLDISRKDRLLLQADFGGMSGKRPLPVGASDWESYDYRTRVVLDYSHDFARLSFDVNGRFGLSNFNYRPTWYNGKQQFLSGGGEVGVRSTDASLPLQYCIRTGFDYYQRQNDLLHHDVQQGKVHTVGEVSGAMNDLHSVAIGFRMDNFFFQNVPFKSHTTLGLSPHFDFSGENWHLRAGANVDMAFGYGKRFYVSPDVEGRYTFAGRYVAYVRAEGGRHTADFTRLEELNPYAQLDTQPFHTYEQLNASVGLKAAPVDGLWLHFFGGYQRLRDDIEAVASTLSGTYHYDWVSFMQGDTQNAYAGFALRYDYRRLFAFGGDVTYRHWDADEASCDPMLYYKPMVEGNACLEVYPLSALQVRVGFRGVKREKVGFVQVDPVCDLYAELAYELPFRLTIYAKGDNLINRRYQYYCAYEAQGVALLGGLSFRF